MLKKQYLIGLVAIIIIAGALAGAYYFWQKSAGIGAQKACTMEAKLCPDESSVGRSGPNCDFAPCPGPLVGGDRDEHGCIGSAGYSWCQARQKCLRIWEESCLDMSAWQTSKGDGFEFRYPENFGANIWRAFEWPPKAAAVLENEDSIKKGCPNIPDGITPEKSQVTLGGLNFDLYKLSDGAAGSTYTTYCYTTKLDQEYYAIQFVIRYTTGCGESCGPYCGTENEAVCQNFDKVKEVEKPIEQMVATFKFTK
jgi:hypothetical protein